MDRECCLTASFQADIPSSMTTLNHVYGNALVNKDCPGENVAKVASWVGKPFPHFSMMSELEHEWTNQDLQGSWNVLFFYPKDRSPGCSVQAQTFVDEEKQFSSLGAKVFGVSSDSIKSHTQFKCDLGGNLTLLCDSKSSLRKDLGLGKTLGIIPHRVTFVLDPRGVVRWAYNSQFSVKKHVYGSLKYLSTV